MGFSTKQVLGDQELDWSSGVLPSELQKPLEAKMEPLKCPRCDSINTKFCYYNNYNKSQPRHFCKSCKRHWTKGGTLRNVPIGGVRKIKKVKKKIKKHQPSVNSFTENVSGNNGGFLHENEGFQFSFSSLSNFEMNMNMNPLLNSVPCFESFVDFKHEPEIEAGDDSSAITNLMVNTNDNIINDNQSWELPNSWNWNDLVSADLNIPWNGDDGDDHIKP